MHDRIEKDYHNEDDICSVFAKYIDIESSKKITLKLVFNYFNNNWHFLIGKAHLDEQHASENLIYPDLVFVSMTLEVSSFKQFIRVLQTEGISYSDEFPVIKPENLNWKERLIPKTHSIGRPIRSFETRIVENSNTFNDKKLFAYKQPYSNSSKELVRSYIGMQTFHGSSDSRAGKLVIEFIDQRGCLFLESNQLRFESDEPAYMTGEIIYTDSIESISSENNAAVDVELKEAKSCDIFLVNQQNEVLDFITSSHYEFSISMGESKNKNQLLNLIQGGENEYVEFKQFINVEKGIKRKDIDKTVCAFSNNVGGTLFIGVSDDVRVTGIECGDFGKTYQNDIEVYVKAIKKYLAETLRISNCFNIFHSLICEEKVVVVEVFKAERCNQIEADNAIYIRKGASSRQATSDEMLALSINVENYN